MVMPRPIGKCQMQYNPAIYKHPTFPMRKVPILTQFTRAQKL
jgi:hypothetical protein